MPRCVRCGHEICPCCADFGVVWCDQVGAGEPFDECCDGECVVEVELAEVQRLGASAQSADLTHTVERGLQASLSRLRNLGQQHADHGGELHDALTDDGPAPL